MAAATAHARLLAPEAEARRKAPMAAATAHALLLAPEAKAVRRRKAPRRTRNC